MSDLAIAAVTATLRGLLFNNTNTDVTTLPPDKANQAPQGNRLNLFLYHVTFNAAWRKQAIPTTVRKGELGVPPLALNLHYLITAYGDDQLDEADHRLLGRAMRSLHDNPVLDSGLIQNSFGDAAPLSQAKMNKPFEPVRLTPETLSVDEMSRLWTTFQTQYRVSACYQASVVLLESQIPPRSPLPVLKRGSEDRGVAVSAAAMWDLDGIDYRDLRTREPAFPAAQLNDIVTLRGSGLPTHQVAVLVSDPNRQPTPADPAADVVARLKPESDSTSQRVYVKLDENLASWVSGQLQIQLELQQGSDKPQRSRPLLLALAPTVTTGTGLNGLLTHKKGLRKLMVTCSPRLATQADGTLPDVSLLLSDPTTGLALPPIAHDEQSNNASPTTLVFDVDKVPPGKYRLRLRIDTVETVMFRRNGPTFDFDDRQMVQL